MGKNGKRVICVSTREASLKKRLRRHLKSLGFHKTDDGTLLPPAPAKTLFGQFTAFRETIGWH